MQQSLQIIIYFRVTNKSFNNKFNSFLLNYETISMLTVFTEKYTKCSHIRSHFEVICHVNKKIILLNYIKVLFLSKSKTFFWTLYPILVRLKITKLDVFQNEFLTSQKILVHNKILIVLHSSNKIQYFL